MSKTDIYIKANYIDRYYVKAICIILETITGYYSIKILIVFLFNRLV